MNEIRKKQQRHYHIMKYSAIAGAIFIFVYIGVSPYVAQLDKTLSTILNYVCDVVVIAVLAALFSYYSKYGKCERFLNHAESEINDAGYYITSRTEKSVQDYCNAVYDDLSSMSYSMTKELEITEMDFFARAMKSREFFYIADFDELDKNDVIAYLDAVTYDITANNLKRRGSGVICFVCNHADDGAISLSKMVTPYGRKEQLNIAIAIAELSTRRVYFLGNEKTKCQQLIANFVMNCDLPIKDKYIGNERLPFQYELEEKMKSFTTNSYKNGNFYFH